MCALRVFKSTEHNAEAGKGPVMLLTKLDGGPQAIGRDNGADDLVIKMSAKNLIQTNFDNKADMSVMSDKDVQKAARRAERDERKAKAAAEVASQSVQSALQGSKPVIVRNACVLNLSA